jgi:hypothetical protein
MLLHVQERFALRAPGRRSSARTRSQPSGGTAAAEAGVDIELRAALNPEDGEELAGDEKDESE